MADRSDRPGDTPITRMAHTGPLQRLAPRARIFHHGPERLATPLNRPKIRLQFRPTAITRFSY
jgi:hypothetical protein